MSSMRIRDIELIEEKTIKVLQISTRRSIERIAGLFNNGVMALQLADDDWIYFQIPDRKAPDA